MENTSEKTQITTENSDPKKEKKRQNANANILARNYKAVRIILRVIMEINAE